MTASSLVERCRVIFTYTMAYGTGDTHVFLGHGGFLEKSHGVSSSCPQLIRSSRTWKILFTMLIVILTLTSAWHRYMSYG